MRREPALQSLALQKREMVGKWAVVNQKTIVASLKRCVWLLNVELGLSGACDKAISRETHKGDGRGDI